MQGCIQASDWGRSKEKKMSDKVRQTQSEAFGLDSDTEANGIMHAQCVISTVLSNIFLISC